MKKKIVASVICLVSFLSLFSGCVNIPEELTQFSIYSFEAEPEVMTQGSSSNLSWVVVAATSVNIDNGIGNVALTGHRIVFPTQNTTYILTASNATTTRSASVTIIVTRVSNESEEPEETSEISIVSFGATPSIIDRGDSSNLSWVVTGATSVVIDNGIGSVSLDGTRIIMPTVTTTYTLTASNTETTKTATTQIVVEETMNTNSNRIAVIDTSIGTIRIELYEDEMPITTTNFIRLVNDGFYNGLIFHRIGQDFMIQSGGYYPNGTQKTSPYGNIQFETSDVKHVDGAISMASTGAKVGGGAQFFICDGAQSFLDGNYAAFGIVIEGIDVVRTIAEQPHADSGDGTGKPDVDIVINSITIVSGTNDGIQNQTPNIACTTDSTMNRITIATADLGVRWSDIAITTDNAQVIWRVYSAVGSPLDLPNQTSQIWTNVAAGEYILLSFDPYTNPTNVKVTMRYIPTNSLLGTWMVNV